MQIKAYEVSKIVQYMRDLVEDDMLLSSIWVVGEVSNLTKHSSGHLFFDLKDDKAILRCVIFKGEASQLPFEMEEGQLLQVYGRISLYKERGELRFIGEFADVKGQGNIQQGLEKLKEKLKVEGVFENRRPLPKYPRKIAIITSPTGAAIRDMLKIIKQQNPIAQVVLVPALVQGEGAVADIVRSIASANAALDVDVIILGRGGGSVEDLWAFNTEAVARAVYGSTLPIVSAVGHETDFTLCDFAADVRAATPTEAAQMV
ncbi:MAG: exodeoxyribonuclease VII large subunit, partial [Defluviitaleaceae bacterium]|nr:exodeoxyribonuclease VII large subunit [Defluviitaleaceae bacterium]